MAQEIEIKLKINDAKAFKRELKRLGARPADGGSGRVHEWNVIFDTPEGGLAKHGQLLRIRIETPETKSKKGKAAPAKRTVLTFKRPIVVGGAHSASSQENHRHKVREEIEVEVANAECSRKNIRGTRNARMVPLRKVPHDPSSVCACELGEGLAHRIG